MIKQSWALLIVASFASALGPPPHRMDEGSLRSALNAVNRKQRSSDSSPDEYFNDLHFFKFYSGQDRDRIEDLEFLPFENGQLETIGDSFQKSSPSGYWTDKKPDTNLGTRLFDRMIVQYLGRNANQEEAVPSALRERDLVGGQKRGENGVREDIDDRLLAKLFIEELQDETFPNQVEVDDGDDVDNLGFWYNKQRFESANKNKGFDFFNTPKSRSSTFGKQSAKDQVRDPLYAAFVEHRNVNSRFPLEREYKEYREFRKRYPVTKRSPTSIQPKTKAIDQKAAQDLGDLFGVKANDHHGHTRNHEHDHDHVHSHDHHLQQTSEAPNPTTLPKDEEEKVTEQSKPREHPMEIKKKSLDWSQYFGIDKRKKKSTLLARPGTQDQDDEWLLQQYYKVSKSRDRNPLYDLVMDHGLITHCYRKRTEILLKIFSRDTDENQNETTTEFEDSFRIIDCDTNVGDLAIKLFDDTPSFVEKIQCDNCPQKTFHVLVGSISDDDLVSGDLAGSMEKNIFLIGPRQCQTNNCNRIAKYEEGIASDVLILDVYTTKTENIRIEIQKMAVTIVDPSTSPAGKFSLIGVILYEGPPVRRRHSNDEPTGHYKALSLRQGKDWIEYDDLRLEEKKCQRMPPYHRV